MSETAQAGHAFGDPNRYTPLRPSFSHAVKSPGNPPDSGPMPSDLIQLVYVSSAAPGLGEDALGAIRSRAVTVNQPLGITGVLLYRSGTFLQLLEGPGDTVDDLYTAIMGDPRHTDVTLLVRRPCNERVASAWSMGVLNLDAFDPGFAPVIERVMDLGRASHEIDDHDRAQELIASMTAIFAGWLNAA
jgi:hypothetical protein